MADPSSNVSLELWYIYTYIHIYIYIYHGGRDIYHGGRADYPDHNDICHCPPWCLSRPPGILDPAVIFIMRPWYLSWRLSYLTWPLVSFIMAPLSRYHGPAVIRLPILSRRRCCNTAPMTFFMVPLCCSKLHELCSKSDALKAKLRCQRKALQAKLFKQSPKK